MKTDGRVRRRPEIYNDIANARAATDFVRPPTAGAARVPPQGLFGFKRACMRARGRDGLGT